ncbi:hypothetical protein JCM1840_004155 [Sporobolomyces johnsonii]
MSSSTERNEEEDYKKGWAGPSAGSASHGQRGPRDRSSDSLIPDSQSPKPHSMSPPPQCVPHTHRLPSEAPSSASSSTILATMSDSTTPTYHGPSHSHHDQQPRLPSQSLDLKPSLDSLALYASSSSVVAVTFADDDTYRTPQPKPEPDDDGSVTLSGSPVDAAQPVPDQDTPRAPSLVLEPVKKEDPFLAAQAEQDLLKGWSIVNAAMPAPRRKRSRAPSVGDADQVKREEDEEARLERLVRAPSAATVSGSEQPREDSAAPFRSLEEYRRMEDEAGVDVHNREFGGGGVEEEQERLPDGDLDMEYTPSVSTLFNEEEEGGEDSSEGGSTSTRSPSMVEPTPGASGDEDEDDEDYEHGDDDYNGDDARPSKKKRTIKLAPKGEKPSQGKLPVKVKTLADQVDAFLATIKLPEPTPISAKLRLTNQLAHSTISFPPSSRVKPIEATSHPSPAIQDELDESMQETVDPGGPSQLAASADLARPPSPADSLEEYDDLQDPPEGPFGVEEEEVELAEEQAYWKNPTREGAISRWAMALHKDAVPLDDALSWETFSTDLASLRRLSLSTSHAHLTLPRNFQTVAAGPLVTHRPSPAICTELWADLLNASHAGRHAQSPRRCWCPLWVPAKRKSWAEEVREIEKEKLEVEDLDEVLERVFARRREDGMLQFVHDMNWLWFDQILQLARIKHAYRRLASEDVVNDLSRKITQLGGEHKQALALAQDKLQRAERARASAQVVNDLHVDVELMKSAWSAKEHDLKALEKRLLQRLEESTGMAKGPTKVAHWYEGVRAAQHANQ